MKFSDIIFANDLDELKEMLEVGKKLGFKRFCQIFDFKKFNEKIEEEVKEIGKELEIDLCIGVEVKTFNQIETIRRKRKNFEFVIVRGGNVSLNRKALDTKEIDLIYNLPTKANSGFNHIMAKIARKNDVLIGINFRNLLEKNENERIKFIKALKLNLKLAKKYKAKIVVFSGAKNKFELKDPKILISFLVMNGFDLKEAKKCISKNLNEKIEENRKRLSEKWIMPGVRVIK
ncbi:MAG: hypothetical protein B6U78_02025 [Candidatus Aenigmarchaeota archaeon ex4484_224]|nr:MAG: hypothetical protein B6U78_02025 [Candidatus Aenigmarchaeota archaeon ex4484_224]